MLSAHCKVLLDLHSSKNNEAIYMDYWLILHYGQGEGITITLSGGPCTQQYVYLNSLNGLQYFECIMRSSSSLALPDHGLMEKLVGLVV